MTQGTIILEECQNMIQSILIPLDGPPASISALERGVNIANLTNAEMRGLFVGDEARLFLPGMTPVFPLSIGVVLMNASGSQAPSEEILKEREDARQQVGAALDE